MAVAAQVFPPPITQDPPLHGPVLLRDGRPAYLREARRDDLPGLVALLNRASAGALQFRFFGSVARGEQAAELLIQTSAKARAGDGFPGLSLVVTIGEAEEAHIAGVGSCVVTGPNEAEIAFLVEDAFQGKGIGTLLLERLAWGAEIHGIKRLTATTLPENRQMIKVFRDSGYQVERELDHGEIRISFEIEPTEETVRRAEIRDKESTKASLVPFFRPQAVAVIGASRNAQSIGSRVLHNLVRTGFAGPVFPINPHARSIASIPAYPSIGDVPCPVDLAVIAVPQPLVMGVVDECAAKGVRALVILTAGFAETGPEGRALQEQLVEKVRGHGMRMVGPNCLGMLSMDPAVNLNATFAPVAPLPGRVAMSSQSGALGLSILESAKELGLGFSSFVSIGNKADVSSNDLMQFWEDDPQTDLIVLYLESFGNPRRFGRLARRVSRKKPILAVKSGRTTAGRRAATSHTAALAVSDTGADAIFKQTGVIRVDTLGEMFDVASFLAHQPLPRGRRVAIATNSGGPAILCADALEARGLVLPTLGEATQKKLREFLPVTAALANPVDMIASAGPEAYRRAVPVLLDDEQIDAVIAIYIPAGVAEAEAVGKAVREGRAAAATGRTKPLVACFMNLRGMHEVLSSEEEAIPSYQFPESAARAVARAVEYEEWRRKPVGVVPFLEGIDEERAKAICQRAIDSRGGGWLLPDEVDGVLGAFGIPHIETVLCRTVEEAVGAASRVGYPVAIKLASTTLVHKTDVGGVHLNLTGPKEVEKAFVSMREALVAMGQEGAMIGATVQPMARDGVEVMIGVTEDPSFGPLVAFGLGGVTVELLGDVVFRITPLTDQDAIGMIRSVRGYKLLDGYRRTPKADKEALVEMLLRVSRLVEEVPGIVELDLNPIRVFEEGKGALALDARIKIRKSS